MCEERKGDHSAKEGSGESPECGLVRGELLDAGTQRKWGELFVVASLAHQRGLAYWVLAPQKRGCTHHCIATPLPIFSSIFGMAQPRWAV